MYFLHGAYQVRPSLFLALGDASCYVGSLSPVCLLCRFLGVLQSPWRSRRSQCIIPVARHHGHCMSCCKSKLRRNKCGRVSSTRRLPLVTISFFLSLVAQLVVPTTSSALQHHRFVTWTQRLQDCYRPPVAPSPPRLVSMSVTTQL